MPIDLAIVTPTEEALSLDCDEVIAPGVNGEIGLLPGHVPLITALRPGVLTVVHDGKKSLYAVASGFAEIEGDTVRILTELCEEASTVDGQGAISAMQEAETKIADMSPDTEGFAELQRRIRINRARAEAAERLRPH